MKPDTIILTQQSFDKLFRLYQRKLYAVAYSLVHDANTAEDIVHDSFMTIWENRETVQFTSIEAYLFGVVKKRCLKYRRDRYTGKAVYEKILMKERGVMDFYTRTIESCNPNELFQREIIEICRKQLEQMPELTKQVFIAHKLEGKSYKEIADMLCINLKKVDRELSEWRPSRGRRFRYRGRPAADASPGQRPIWSKGIRKRPSKGRRRHL